MGRRLLLLHIVSALTGRAGLIAALVVLAAVHRRVARLVGRRLVAAGLLRVAGLARGGLLVARCLIALLSAPSRDAERGGGPHVDAAGRLQTIPLLEHDQRLARALTEDAVRLPDVEALLLEDDLELADFVAGGSDLGITAGLSSAAALDLHR